MAIEYEEVEINSPRTTRAKLPVDARHRKMLPVETFSVTAGIKGGIVGGIAMVIPATIFSLLRYHSVWYAVNLLAAGGFVSWAGQSNAFLAQFHALGLLAALGIHALTSVLIGLLYGAMLPMFPRKPILTAGFLRLFCGPASCIRRSASSARFWMSASIGCGSLCPNSLRAGVRLCGESAGAGAHVAIPGTAVFRSRRTAPEPGGRGR